MKADCHLCSMLLDGVEHRDRVCVCVRACTFIACELMDLFGAHALQRMMVQSTGKHVYVQQSRSTDDTVKRLCEIWKHLSPFHPSIQYILSMLKV